MNEIDEIMIKKASKAAVITGIVIMVVMVLVGILSGRIMRARNLATPHSYTDETWTSISKPISVVTEISNIYITSEVRVTIEKEEYVTRPKRIERTSARVEKTVPISEALTTVPNSERADVHTTETTTELTTLLSETTVYNIPEQIEIQIDIEEGE